MTAADELLTVDEAAPIVRLHPVTLYRKLRDREIESVRQGRKVLIRRSAIDAYLDECTVHAAEQTGMSTTRTKHTPPATQQRPSRNPNRTYKT